MTLGLVKSFNAHKGHGFIRLADGLHGVFVPISAVERSGMSNLTQGQRPGDENEAWQRGKSSSAVGLRAV